MVRCAVGGLLLCRLVVGCRRGLAAIRLSRSATRGSTIDVNWDHSSSDRDLLVKCAASLLLLICTAHAHSMDFGLQLYIM